MKQKTVFSDVTVAAAKLSKIVNIDDRRRKKVSHQELNHMNCVWNDIFNRLPAHSSCVCWRLYNTLLRTKCYRVDCRRLFTGCGERVTLVCVVCVCVWKRVCWQFRLRIARYSRRMFHVCLMIGRFSWQRESFKTNRTFHRANRIQIIWNDRMYTATWAKTMGKVKRKYG